MGSPDTSQQSWPPYGNISDCSQGFCSIYCPQWCYIVFPPPPPSGYLPDNSGSNFSPLVIAVIGILASAFLLVCYYTIVSRYCRRADQLGRRRPHGGDPAGDFDWNRDPGGHDAWRIATRGLDESVIKSIAVYKYKKGEGLVEGTDCSVCLSEFREDDSLRLLPKCSHSFHVPCIDTWLKSHSNCPLCRANIVSPGSLLPPPLPVGQENPPEHHPAPGGHGDNDSIANVADLLERGGEEEVDITIGRVACKSHGRALSNLEDGGRLVELREETIQPIRRSISMDSICQDRILIADVLVINMEDEFYSKGRNFSGGAGSSHRCREENSRFSSNNRSRMLNCVTSHIVMKRSSSSSSLSGRFPFAARCSRGRNSILPL